MNGMGNSGHVSLILLHAIILSEICLQVWAGGPGISGKTASGLVAGNRRLGYGFVRMLRQGQILHSQAF